MTVLVGADPEIFVRNKKGQLRSAHGLIPGTKKEPYKVKNGAVQVDGMALEFNIDPADTKEAFIHNVGSVMRQLGDMVPDYDLHVVPSVRFHWRHLAAQPKEALELGCEPDFNAYTEQETPKPNANTTLRTAAGHVHVGFCEDADPRDPEHFQRCVTLVKVMDAFLGVPSLNWDSDQKRRTLYGKAGAFRPKPYGVEYRTLSNAWLKRPELVGFVFDATQNAVNFLRSGERLSTLQTRYVKQSINTGYAYYKKWADTYLKGIISYAPVEG